MNQLYYSFCGFLNLRYFGTLRSSAVNHLITKYTAWWDFGVKNRWNGILVNDDFYKTENLLGGIVN